MTLLEKSLGENFREYDNALLGMRQDGDWLLYAGYNDQEKIRNVFCSNLWMNSCAANNGYGITGGMEYRYVELFREGEYWGLYALGFPLDARQMELKQDRNGNHIEFLFKNNRGISPEMGTTPEEIFRSQHEVKFTAQTSVQEKAWDLLADYERCMKNSSDIAEIRQMNDMANTIDVYLFLNLIQGIDNSDKNMYITFKEKEGTYQGLYTPWDMDYAWGNAYTGVLTENYTREYSIRESDNVVFELSAVPRLQVLGDTEINGQVRQRYEQLRKGAWSEESLRAMLNGFEKDIFLSGAFVRDKQRWPQGSYIDADKRLSVFKDYVAKRLQYMDAFVAALP